MYDPSNIAHVINCNAIEVLVQQFEDSVVEGVEPFAPLDAEWQANRSRLEVRLANAVLP
jgi:hypothetical protein